MVDHEAQRVPASRDLCACLGRTITLPVFSPENYVGRFPWLNLNGEICLTPFTAACKIRDAIINRAYLVGISPEQLTPKMIKGCVSVLDDLLVKNSYEAHFDFCLETIEETQERLRLTIPQGAARLEEWS